MPLTCTCGLPLRVSCCVCYGLSGPLACSPFKMRMPVTEREPKGLQAAPMPSCSAAVQVRAASSPGDHVPVWWAIRRGGDCVPEQH